MKKCNRYRIRIFPKRFIRVGWHQWKEINICSKSKEFKSNRPKITKFGPNFRTISQGGVFFHFILFLHTAYYSIRAILIWPSIPFWTTEQKMNKKWTKNKKKWTKNEHNMNKKWTKNEQTINKKWTKNEQTMNKKWTKNEQKMNKK